MKYLKKLKAKSNISKKLQVYIKAFVAKFEILNIKTKIIIILLSKN